MCNAIGCSAVPSSLPPPFRLNLGVLSLSFVTGLWVLMTIFYAWGLTITRGTLVSLIPESSSRATLYLQILNGGATIFLAQLLWSTLETVLWATASSDGGITISSLLSTSPCTGVLGLLELFRWKTNAV